MPTDHRDDFFPRAHLFLIGIDRLVRRAEPIFRRLIYFILSLFGLVRLIWADLRVPW